MQVDEFSGESSAPTARLDTIKLIAARAASCNRISRSSEKAEHTHVLITG